MLTESKNKKKHTGNKNFKTPDRLTERVNYRQ